MSSFAAPEGEADLRFVVRDKASGRAGSLRMTLDVPAFGPGEVVLSPPLAMDDPRSRLVVPAASRARPELEIPLAARAMRRSRPRPSRRCATAPRASCA